MLSCSYVPYFAASGCWCAQIFQSEFFNSTACHAYISDHPVPITTAVIASLVADAWPHSLTPLNILSGFKKCGIHPLDPGEVNDRQLAPSKALHAEKSQPDKEPNNLFTRKQESVYERRIKGYDVNDLSYIAWLRINHLDTSPPYSVSAVSIQRSTLTGSSSSWGILSELLVLPKHKKSNKKRKPALNNKTVSFTDCEVLEKLKTQEKEKIAVEDTKKAKQFERKRKRLE